MPGTEGGRVRILAGPARGVRECPIDSKDGSVVGNVTSAIYSPRLNKNIGYCWVPTNLATEGTQVQVQTEWGSRTARVVPMPFVDPSKKIPVS